MQNPLVQKSFFIFFLPSPNYQLLFPENIPVTDCYMHRYVGRIFMVPCWMDLHGEFEVSKSKNPTMKIEWKQILERSSHHISGEGP